MTRYDSIRLESMTSVPFVPHPQRWGSETPAEHGDRETGRPSWGTPATETAETAETAKAGWGCGEVEPGGTRWHEAARGDDVPGASFGMIFQHFSGPRKGALSWDDYFMCLALRTERCQ